MNRNAKTQPDSSPFYPDSVYPRQTKRTKPNTPFWFNAQQEDILDTEPCPVFPVGDIEELPYKYWIPGCPCTCCQLEEWHEEEDLSW